MITTTTPVGQMAFSVCIQETHTCGQIFSQTMTLKMDEVFSLNLSTDPFTLDVEHALEITRVIHEKIALSGHVERTEVNGIEVVEGVGLVCLGCGAPLLQREKD